MLEKNERERARTWRKKCIKRNPYPFFLPHLITLGFLGGITYPSSITTTASIRTLPSLLLLLFRFRLRDFK